MTCVSDYSTRIVTEFKAVVAAHAAQHSYNDYLLPLFKHQGKPARRRAMSFHEAIRHNIPVSEWIEEHVSDSNLPFATWLNFSKGTAEQIGEIDGKPVYFNRTAGIYGYADSEDAENMLDLWLTSPHYPPGW